VTQLAPAQALVAYTAAGAEDRGFGGGNLNLGRTFTVGALGVTVTAFGFYDNYNDGLDYSHIVTLFSRQTPTPVALLSQTVAAGTSGALIDGFRFADLTTPLFLSAGNYALMGYGFIGNDWYADHGGLPAPASGVTDGGFDPYRFIGDLSPAYPNGGDTNNHTSVSFLYTIGDATGGVPEPAAWAMMILGIGLIGSTKRLQRRKMINAVA
jgi:hypothetical protein